MPKPTSHGIDVDPGAQKVGRGGVADGMGAHAFCRQRGHFGDDFEAVALNGCMDFEASDGLRHSDLGRHIETAPGSDEACNSAMVADHNGQ